MKNKVILAMVTIVLGFSVNAFGQKNLIQQSVEQKEAISHFRYLAADELKGRDAMRSEIDVAARYISEQFWKYGARELPNAEGYYQPVPFKVSAPPSFGEVKLGETTYAHGEDMLVLDGAGDRKSVV